MEWMPIETCPRKSGNRVLLWEEYSENPFVGYWSDIYMNWQVCLEHVDAEGGWEGANAVSDIQCDVTHWMPLPKPPTD